MTAAPPVARRAAGLVRLGVVIVLVGVGSGIGAIALYLLLQVVQMIAFGFPFRTSLEAADAPSAADRLVALVVVGVVAAVAWWALRRWGPSIVRVEEAVAGTRMHGGATALNAGIQITAVGLGASIGKEVAPRELGAWLAQLIVRRAGLTLRQGRVLVACGAAAGLAAIYDVPLGGALFGLEVLLGELTLATAVPAFATSAIAALVGRIVVPDEVLYRVPATDFSPSLTAWAVLAGPVLGLAGVGFGALALRAGRRAPRGWRILLVLPIAFALVGVVAIWFPSILGNGRALGLIAMNARLDAPAVLGLPPIALLLVLALLKTATTLATIGGGAVGGTLTPSIAIGSAAGAGLGGLWLLLWPGSGLAAFAFVGAAAFLAATMRAPFTAVLLVLEFTDRGLPILIPTLLAVAGATAVSVLLRRRRLAGVE